MDDNQNYHALSEEIDRIIISPYPTQLKGLRDLLCTKFTSEDISRWTLSKPCQVARLVRCILQELQRWPYVLDIVRILSHDIKIRDAFLLEAPTLLHDVVTQAVKERGAGSRYTCTAVVILSHPLPTSTTLPSDVQALFIRLFDVAAAEPSVVSIRPVYQILQGTATLLLGLLSSSVLLRFENHLFEILRNLKGDNPSLSLYCIAIMKILAEVSNEDLNGLSVSSYDTQELLASTQLTTSTKWKPETVQQYFAERKAQKTMQLIVLRVMWACTTTTGESFDEKLESLRLANEIIVAVPVHEREIWRKANVLIPKKFEEKIFAPALDSSLRFQALCFLVRLTEGSTIPPGVLAGLREIVHKANNPVKALRSCDSASAECLARSGVFDEHTTTAFVQHIVDFVADGYPGDILESSATLMQLLQQLSQAITEHASIAEGAMLGLDVLACGHKLKYLAGLVRGSTPHIDHRARSDMCIRTLHSARNHLIHELCGLFLKAALFTSHQSYSISQDTLSLLLALHASSAQVLPSCCHVQSENAAMNHAISFVEAENTPDDTAVDWRAALRSEINTRAEFEHERLATLFSKSCADLERRCHDVEKPLREEQERRCALQERHDELERAYTTLESESIDRAVQFNALEMDRDQYLNEFEAARAENERWDAKHQKLESKLQEAEAKIAEEASKSKHAEEIADLRHSTELARKEEVIEDLQTQLQCLKEELTCRKEELDNLKNQLAETTSNLESNRQNFEQLNHTCREQQAHADRLADETKILQRHINEYESQVAGLNTKLDNEQNAHKAGIKRLESEMTEKLAAVEDAHQQKLVALSNEHDEVVQPLKRKLSDIEDELSQAQSRNASEITQRDMEIADKHKKLNRLQRKCDQKDKQITEANAMRSNLMAAMGIGKQQSPVALPLRPSISSSTAQTQHQELESQEDPSPPTPCSGDDAEMQQLDVGQSFASNVSSNESRSGPTPKRPRPKRSSKIGSPARPRVRTSTTLHPVRSVAKRQPLSNISANATTSKAEALRTPSKQNLLGFDETTFDGSELFTGTPGLDDMLA